MPKTVLGVINTFVQNNELSAHQKNQRIHTI